VDESERDNKKTTAEILAETIVESQEQVSRRFKELDKIPNLSEKQFDQLLGLARLAADNTSAYVGIQKVLETERENKDKVKRHPNWGE